MSQKTNLKPLAIALGTAFVTTLAATPAANATENPFAMSELSSGYMVAESMEGKCGEGKCGGAKATEAKCGEGKCGMDMMDADGDGKITKDEFVKSHEAMFSKKDKNGDGVVDASEMKAMEGKCGEGKCGAEKAVEKATEGKCGEGKCGAKKAVEKATEGKCGEGKCGAKGAAGKVMEAKCGEGKCGGNK